MDEIGVCAKRLIECLDGSYAVCLCLIVIAEGFPCFIERRKKEIE